MAKKQSRWCKRQSFFKMMEVFPMKYTAVEMDIVEFDVEDVIDASNPDIEQGEEEE